MGLNLKWRGWVEFDDSWVEKEEDWKSGLKEEVYAVADQDRNQNGKEDTFNVIEVAEYGSFEDGWETDEFWYFECEEG